MKIALVGAGVIAKTHAKALDAIGCELCAICDIDVKKAEELAALYAPKAEIYTEYEKMLDNVKPDVLHICTPHYLHATQTVCALDRGINVLCEKPICAHREELEYVIEAAKRSSATLGVCHQNRYNESVVYAKKLFEGKKIVASHGSVCWSRGEEYYAESPWRGKLYEAGGGSLINQALHTLDLLQLFCSMPKYVSARADILVPRHGVEVEDTVTAVFEKGDKSRYTFFSTNNNQKNLPVELCFKLDSGESVIVLPKSVVVDGKTVFSAESDNNSLGKSYYGGGHARLFADYYDCLESGRAFPIDAEEAAKVVRLIFAVYECHGEKTEIN